MYPVLNVCAYRFVPLDGLVDLRERLQQSAAAHLLKGTLLLADEGINLSLAGEPAAVREWLAQLRCDARFAGLQGHESLCTEPPFKHLRVKVKREIVRMNRATIRPVDGRAASVDALTLARWITDRCDDDGRELALLDTRNGFEVDLGAFDGAVDWRLRRFGDFPAALADRAAQLAGKTVVSYCTGGIRCEKAALLMLHAGLAPVFQLDGGILRYLRTHGSNAPGWHGECFVFDQRIMLDGASCARQPPPGAIEPRA